MTKAKELYISILLSLVMLFANKKRVNNSITLNVYWNGKIK